VCHRASAEDVALLYRGMHGLLAGLFRYRWARFLCAIPLLLFAGFFTLATLGETTISSADDLTIQSIQIARDAQSGDYLYSEIAFKNSILKLGYNRNDFIPWLDDVGIPPNSRIRLRYINGFLSSEPRMVAIQIIGADGLPGVLYSTPEYRRTGDFRNDMLKVVAIFGGFGLAFIIWGMLPGNPRRSNQFAPLPETADPPGLF
jgi:hypothetical protein